MPSGQKLDLSVADVTPTTWNELSESLSEAGNCDCGGCVTCCTSCGHGNCGCCI